MTFVRTTGDVWVVMQSTTPSAEPELRRTLPTPDDAPWWWSVSLFNKHVRSSLILDKSWRQDRGRNFDAINSSVIEFHRCMLTDAGLQAGRIWAEMTLLRDGAILPKEPEFVTWYDEIAGWIRKRFKRLGPLTYAGRGALDIQSKGTELLP